MCELSLYQIYLQAVGLTVTAILICALILIIADVVSFDFIFTDEKKGKK